MPFPTSSAAVEVLVRSLIVAKCAAVDGVGNVLDGPIYIPDKTEAAAQLGVDTVDSAEIRYLSVQWTGFEDTEDGCEDAPHYFINYTLRVGQEFNPARSDGSDSEKDFTAQCFNLRDAFLLDRTFGEPRLMADRLVVSEDGGGVGDDDHTGMFGHTIEFLLKVEVTPPG